MTYNSVITAAINRITTQLPVFTTVADADDRAYEPLRPDDLPACIFTQSAATTQRLAVGGLGVRREEWLLEAHIWRWDNPIPGTAATFRALVESVRVALMGARDYAGAANVGTIGTAGSSQVLTTAEGPNAVQTTFSKPIRRGATAERHALVAVRVRDLVYA